MTELGKYDGRGGRHDSIASGSYDALPSTSGRLSSLKVPSVQVSQTAALQTFRSPFIIVVVIVVLSFPTRRCLCAHRERRYCYICLVYAFIFLSIYSCTIRETLPRILGHS